MLYDPTRVRPTMVAALQDYIDHGTPKGGFLRAVLSDSLLDAAMRADQANYEALAHIAYWCFVNVPSLAWRSRENYSRWMKAHGRVRDERGYGVYALDEVYAEIEKMEEEKAHKEGGYKDRVYGRLI